MSLTADKRKGRENDQDQDYEQEYEQGGERADSVPVNSQRRLTLAPKTGGACFNYYRQTG
jgi:hypothetical protein